MKRRDLITCLGRGANASTIFWPLVARAQGSAKRPMIALLAVPVSSGFARNRNGLLQGLHESGYFEDRNIDLVERYADGFLERLPALAEELVRLKPDVIVAQVSSAALVLKRSTTTVPIVVGTMADPVRLGLDCK
jgi:putative ABC transport system substrate-binding protein